MKKFLEKLKEICQNIISFFEMCLNYILKTIGTDGLLHITTSFLICVALSAISSIIFHNPFVFASIGAVFTLIIGIIKEITDKYSEGHACEVKDVVCDSVGILLGFLISIMFVIN